MHTGSNLDRQSVEAAGRAFSDQRRAFRGAFFITIHNNS